MSASVVAVRKRVEKGRSLRILIVEDNIDSGDTLSTLLRLEGHEVLLVRSGTMALELGLVVPARGGALRYWTARYRRV